MMSFMKVVLPAPFLPSRAQRDCMDILKLTVEPNPVTQNTHMRNNGIRSHSGGPKRTVLDNGVVLVVGEFDTVHLDDRHLEGEESFLV
jgi:hypothetical protein